MPVPVRFTGTWFTGTWFTGTCRPCGAGGCAGAGCGHLARCAPWRGCVQLWRAAAAPDCEPAVGTRSLPRCGGAALTSARVWVLHCLGGRRPSLPPSPPLSLPQIHALKQGGFGWLHEMLECFNSGERLAAAAALPRCWHARPTLPTPRGCPARRNPGDIHRYDELCTRHAALLNGQPALVEHERRLREKITILCLTELIGSLPPDQRTIALSTVAERTKLPLDGVEFLLMKARAPSGAAAGGRCGASVAAHISCRPPGHIHSRRRWRCT